MTTGPAAASARPRAAPRAAPGRARRARPRRARGSCRRRRAPRSATTSVAEPERRVSAPQVPTRTSRSRAELDELLDHDRRARPAHAGAWIVSGSPSARRARVAPQPAVVVEHLRLVEQRLGEQQRAAGVARQQHALGQLGGGVQVDRRWLRAYDSDRDGRGRQAQDRRGDQVREAVDEAFQAAAGQAQVTRERAQEIVDELGRARPGGSARVLEDLRPAGDRTTIRELRRRGRAPSAEARRQARASAPSAGPGQAKPKPKSDLTAGAWPRAASSSPASRTSGARASRARLAADPASSTSSASTTAPPARRCPPRIDFIDADLRSPDIAQADPRRRARHRRPQRDHPVRRAAGRSAAPLHDINVIGTLQLLAACERPPLAAGDRRPRRRRRSTAPSPAPRRSSPRTWPPRPLRTRFQRDLGELESYVRDLRPPPPGGDLHGAAPAARRRAGARLAGHPRCCALPVVPTVPRLRPAVAVAARATTRSSALAAAVARPVRGAVNVAGRGTVSLSRCCAGCAGPRCRSRARSTARGLGAPGVRLPEDMAALPALRPRRRHHAAATTSSASPRRPTLEAVAS